MQAGLSPCGDSQEPVGRVSPSQPSPCEALTLESYYTSHHFFAPFQFSPGPDRTVMTTAP